MSLILTLASFYLAVCEKVSEDLTNMKVKLVVPVFFFFVVPLLRVHPVIHGQPELSVQRNLMPLY